MRYHFFLHYGWLLQNFEKDFIPTLLHTTVPALSKILENVVRDSLLSWFKQKNFLPESQYGFRPDKSVAMALTVAQTDWINAKARNELVGIMAFDLSSAFDTLEHSLH